MIQYTRVSRPYSERLAIIFGAGFLLSLLGLVFWPLLLLSIPTMLMSPLVALIPLGTKQIRWQWNGYRWIRL